MRLIDDDRGWWARNWVKLLICLALGCFVTAIIYPIWFPPRRHIPNAHLVEGDGWPLSNRRIRITGKNGWEWVVTDASGGFDVRSPFRVEGYVLARQGNSTGDGPFRRYVFGPLANISFRFRDEHGKPVEGEATTYAVERAFHERSQNGDLQVTDAPVNTWMEVRALDVANWKVGSILREWQPGELTVQVILSTRLQSTDMSADPRYGWQRVPARTKIDPRQLPNSH